MTRRNSVAGLGSFSNSRTLRLEALEERRLLALTPELVADIAVGASAPDELTAVNGMLYFSAFEDSTGRELWKSNGTEGGTQLVRDLAPGSHEVYVCDEPIYCNNGHYETVPIDSSPSFLTNVNGTLYYEAYEVASGQELRKSDGTEAGTVTVKDILAGSSSSSPYLLTDVNGTLFFTANYDGSGFELWKSDGAEAGTVRVKDFHLGTGERWYPRSLTNVNGTLFFTARNFFGTGRELWKSDGTEAGTVRIRNFSTSPFLLTNVNGTLFFSAVDGASGNVLWKSDGTVSGTVPVKDIHTGTDWGSIGNLTNVDGTLYFSADDGVSGEELWKSDGTNEGTQLVRDLAPGSHEEYVCDFYDPREEICERGHYEMVPDSSLPHNLTPIGAQLYFATNDRVHGDELWVSDGTAAGTYLVADIADGPTDSAPTNLTAVGSMLFFTAADDIHGEELWVSDGTAAGTYLVADIATGPTASAPTKLTAVGNMLYFTADDGMHGRELWKVIVEDKAVPGDTDADGDVDLEDLNNVRNHFGKVGGGVLGDTAPFDGDVDLDDLNAVRNNFGAALVNASARRALGSFWTEQNSPPPPVVTLTARESIVDALFTMQEDGSTPFPRRRRR